MKKKTAIVRFLPNKSELVDNVTDFISSFTTSLPGAISSPETILSGALGQYAGKRVLKWGQTVLLKVKNRKDSDDLVKPIDKFVETLKFISDNKITDAELLEALKNLHAITLSLGTSLSDEIEAYLLIDILRELKGKEVATILACYNIYGKRYSSEKMQEIMKDFETNIAESGPWCQVVSRALGYNNSDYVSVQQNHLESLELITPRSMNTQWTGRTNAAFAPLGRFRLTDSGYRLAEFITKGGELTE